MKDGKFETQAEIFQALLDGKKVTNPVWRNGEFLLLKDGEVSDNNGNSRGYAFNSPEDWIIYEEPKKKKKITLYRETYQYLVSGSIFQSRWSSDLSGDVGINMKLILKESKEIEVDE